MPQHAKIVPSVFRPIRLLVRPSKFTPHINIDGSFFGCWLGKFKRSIQNGSVKFLN